MHEFKKEIIKNKNIYIMALPIIAFYLIFHYAPMYGLLIAFKDFSPRLGILGSKFIGFDNFIDFFNSPSFLRVVRNTVLINLYSLIFSFPAPIILAILLNEIRSNSYKRTVQTITYMPHFISLVVICGMIKDFTSTNGVINDIIFFLGGERSNLLSKSEMFRSIYIISDIWQHIGWGSIIYLAAIISIDQELYEAAYIDGAGRFRRIWNITIPGIMPTIIILLILKVGNMMTVGYEKIILLYSPLTYETADVISSYVYRKGLIDFDFSYSSAVGMFNSIINFILLITANKLSRKFSENSLW